jgi:NAD(P)-dependent dehydrogenase (short-subunit alcohol dehydrogenase family)
MQNLKGKTAFITGGAEGIGFHSARALAGQGMNIMLTDINTEKLEQAIATLKSEGIDVNGCVLDVSVRNQWDAALDKTISAFGSVHFLMNNAGVSVIGGQQNIEEQEWRWIIDVNLMGVVYGCQVFAPHIKSHGEGGHIMNVASMAGMQGIEFASPYCATKAAVVSLSESWRSELAHSGIEVSVLCPGFAKTKIYDSYRNRQQHYGGPVYFDDLVKLKPSRAASKEVGVTGIDVELVAERVVKGVLDNEMYVFTHPQFRQAQMDRFRLINTAFDSGDS